MSCRPWSAFFFFNDTATTEIYTLSLHDALPICLGADPPERRSGLRRTHLEHGPGRPDRKSTRLNSSHGYISYAVFCLKKKNLDGPSDRTRTGLPPHYVPPCELPSPLITVSDPIH